MPPWLNHLSSYITQLAGPFYKKYGDTPWMVLHLLVSIRFQVLFHSPPGVLFTFPSRYYTLSVTKSYLALWDGPHIFTPDSTCPVLLWIPAIWNRFRLRDYYSVSSSFPTMFDYRFFELCRSEPLRNKFLRFGLFRVRSPLLTKSFIYFLFLRVLRCFSSPGSLHTHYIFMRGYFRITGSEFPHSEIYGSKLICSSP